MQTTRIGKNVIWYDNAEEFNELKKEIFTEHRYYLELDKEDPVILDMGAHIGLATLYIKQIYPDAHITAFEPHPDTFALLTKNIADNQLTGVTLVQAAVAPKTGTITLQEASGPGAWRSGVGIIPRGWRGVQDTQSITVPAVSVLDYLTHPVDFLKMDIEGMEYEVIKTAGERLRHVKHIVIEVHPRSDRRMAEIEKVLQSAGFVIEKEVDTDRLGKGLVLLKARRK